MTTNNDAQTLQSRRERVAADWTWHHGPVLIPAGLPIPIDGTDQFHDFHAHPEFRYLSGVAEPGATLAWDPDNGWTLFTPTLSIEDRVWMSQPPSTQEQTRRSGAPTQEFAALTQWLEDRRGQPLALLGNRDIESRPAEYSAPNWTSLELNIDEHATERLGKALAQRRRAKDNLELSKLQHAVDAAIAGHLRAQRTAHHGMTERALQIELEAEFFRHHAQRTAYGSIVGSGPNSAILHGSPTTRTMYDGDLILIDAGAEVDGYASDLTRTFPVAPSFNGLQRHLYDVVLTAQQEAIAAAAPAVEYKHLHLRAAHTIATGLIDADILRGAPTDLVDSDAHALFFPHGLGHMLGLATHDCAGYLDGREPEDRFGLMYLRTDLPLAPGYVLTIEPGIYFIPALLTDPDRRRRYHDQVNWQLVDNLLEAGGIRIEDNIQITESGCNVLSAALPSSADEIEAIRRDALSGQTTSQPEPRP